MLYLQIAINSYLSRENWVLIHWNWGCPTLMCVDFPANVEISLGISPGNCDCIVGKTSMEKATSDSAEAICYRWGFIAIRANQL
jgi:hypothetical protein